MKNTETQKSKNPRDKEEQEKFLSWRKGKMDEKSLKNTEENIYFGKPTILKEKPPKKPEK